MRAMVVGSYFLFTVGIESVYWFASGVGPDATRLFWQGATDKAESRSWYLSVFAEHIA
jgi:hypothetical protein